MRQNGNGKRRLKKPARIGLVIMAMVMALFAGSGLFGGSVTPVYAAEPTSDTNTTGSYAENLGDVSSTRYAGRVWTDKTVYTEDATFTGDVGNVTVENDSDFLVAYSALATTQNITGKSSVPVDVVFVIDNSNSMDENLTNRQTRLEATVAAVNTSIAAIMDSHPDSRVAVVVYGGSAHTLLPLGHYDPMPSGNYISVSGNYSGNNNSYTDFYAVPNHSLHMNGSQRGTNIHMGVDAGMDILKNATDIGEGASKHVPALILLSDGAATYSGQGNWWEPSGQSGSGSDTNNAHALKVAMNAQYNKQQVNEHYGVDDPESSTACKIYTIGMGIEQLNSGGNRNDYYRAQIALDPGNHLTDRNDVANAIEDAWDWYINGKEVTSGPWWDPTTEITYTPELNGYTFEHPETGDISTIAYNDGYYSAENADDVANVFDDITSDIVSSSAQAPTKIEGGDPLKSGYLTYTDPIGEYMEVKDIKSIIYGGKEFTQKSSSESGNTTTYTFTGEKIESPVYGELDVSSIEISVTKDDNGNETLIVKIPAAAIPLRVNTVDIDENGAITNTNNNAYPARILYTVGVRDEVNLETLQGVSDDYISSHLTEDGRYVNFYSNKYSGYTQNNKTVGDAKVTFTPAETNPFFYVQEDTPLYTAPDTNSPAYNSVSNDNTLYFFQITYYEANNDKTEWVSRPGSSFWHDGSTDVTLKTLESGQVAIKKGAPRLGYLDDFAETKTDNSTGTAEQVFHPVYDGNDQFTVYLGNNGLLQANAPKSLTVEKEVAAGNGLTAPDADFTFEVTVASKADTTGDAILTGSDGQTKKTELTFDADGKATFTLKDGQSMEILNIGEGVAYTVKEINLPAGFASDAVDNTKTGTVSDTDENNIVKFTNTYNVTPVTTDDLGISLGGTKSITGRDFQAGDEFVFTIAAAQATKDAPLPDEDSDGDGNATTATVKPASGSEVTFKFGSITFDKPGEYRYVIRENSGELPGVDYDGAIYRVNIIVRDNGYGTMSLASTEGGLTGIGDLNYPTNPFIQVWDGEQQGTVVGAVAFENSYSATSAEAVIQGVKVLNSTNSDRILADGNFTFKIEALGYNTDGGDQFNQIPVGESAQPMPANTEVTNIANGNVNFAAMTFTQDMIGNTYGYKITEKLPQGVNADNPTLNGITYDTSEKIVKVTVTRSDEGGMEHVVATVTPNDGTAEAAKNFTFTNMYEPSSVTIGEDTGNAITVQKTFTGRTWNDSDEFKYTLKSIDGAPMPADGDEISIGKPASGNSNTATFGDIKFTKEGVYEYEITETDGGLGGVTYDKHTAKVTVRVTEDTATGSLSAKVEYDNSVAENNSDKAVQDVAAFTNTYKAVFDTDTTVNLNGTKELTGKTLTDSAFYFIVDPQETASGGHAPTGESVAWNPNKADGSIQLLKNVTYTEAGDYVYIIKEQIPSNKEKGMTYDESEYRITVTVTDDQQGNLTASEPKIEKKAAGAADYTEADAVVFENSYAPLSVTIASPQITKVLDGDRNTPLQDGEFSFEMSVVSADPEDGIILPETTPVSNDANGKVNFGNITFSKVGKYVVQVKEVEPADNADGVTYSTNVKKTTFDVRDESGQLVAYVTGDEGSLTFINTYSATGTSNELTGTKNISGRDFQNGDEFTFEVTGAYDGSDDVIAPLPNKVAENGTITINPTSDTSSAIDFGTITFEKPGTYTYTISEQDVNADIVNVTKDSTVYTVKYTVTDNGNGTMTVSDPAISAGEASAEALVWTNTYSADAFTGVPTDFTLKKQFTGHDWTDNYAFTFTFNPVSSTLDDGTIPMPSNNAVTISGPNGDSTDTAEFNFGSITYDKAGTYKYTVTETDGGLGGVTYAENTAVITVEVTEEKDESGNLTGKLIANATVENGTFVNTYSTHAKYNTDGVGGLDITKVVTNHAMTQGQFSFTIEATGQNAEAAAKQLGITEGTSTVVYSRSADAGKAVSVMDNPFETMAFDKADDGITYTYLIYENGTSHEGDYAHYNLDASQHTVSITAVDNHDGTMTVTTNVDGQEFENKRSTVAFTNSYEADPVVIGADEDVKIEGTKTLANDDINNYTFSFEVKSGETVVSRGTNTGETITFDDITYTTENLADAVTDEGSTEVGKAATMVTTDEGTVYTFNYTVSEVSPSSETGVTANSAAQNITVTVTDDGNGTLTPVVTYGDDDPLAFENTYGGDADYALDISGIKVIAAGETNPSNLPVLKGGEYTFTITGNPAADGTSAPMPAVAEVQNDASGSVVFEDIHYTMENTFGNVNANSGIETYTAGRSKVFTYTISESGQVDGVTNEQAVKTVEVTVTDLGGGKLEAAVTSVKTEEGADFKFTNTYDVTPTNSSLTGDGGFTIQKTLTSANTDRQLAEGEFTFTLTDEQGNVSASALNSADGTVEFAAITFTEPGTYRYKLSEDMNDVAGVDYDQTIYNVTAVVSDNGDGTLSVTWNIDGASDKTVTYNNTYTAASTSVKFEASKVLSGRDLEEGEFTFAIRENGEVIETVTNDTQGKVSFSEIIYDQPGEHDYEIVEIAGDDETMTYDDTVYTVHVSVTDDTKSGTLVAASEYGENGSPVFRNTYTEPQEPAQPAGPDTGVWTNPAPFAVTFTASLAAILAILYRRLH